VLAADAGTVAVLLVKLSAFNPVDIVSLHAGSIPDQNRQYMRIALRLLNTSGLSILYKSSGKTYNSQAGIKKKDPA